MAKFKLKQLVMSSMFMSAGLVLPFITGQIKQVGNMLLPMHIPVILCGLVCGKWWGLAVGFVLPLLRSVVFAMPTLYPNAVAMAFELAAYGFFTDFLFCKFKNRSIKQLYVSLVSSMLLGRIIWGVARAALLGFGGGKFTVGMFVAGAFLNGIPGIIIQLALVPLLYRLICRWMKKTPE